MNDPPVNSNAGTAGGTDGIVPGPGIPESISDDEKEFRRAVRTDIMNRLSAVVDPELGRSITDLNMVVGIDIRPVEGKPTFEELFRYSPGASSKGMPLSRERPYYDVTVHLELTVPGW